MAAIVLVSLYGAFALIICIFFFLLTLSDTVTEDLVCFYASLCVLNEWQAEVLMIVNYMLWFIISIKTW